MHPRRRPSVHSSFERWPVNNGFARGGSGSGYWGWREEEEEEDPGQSVMVKCTTTAVSELGISRNFLMENSSVVLRTGKAAAGLVVIE